MKLASEIEKAYLMKLWTKPVNAVDHPEMATVCPNCLASRAGSVTDTDHAKWCAIGRAVKLEEQSASDYLVQI